MTGPRVPDAAGPSWWYFGTPKNWTILRVSPDATGRMTVDVEPWRTALEYENQPAAQRLGRRWLGPVAPPCPEGRVRVEVPREVAAAYAAGASSALDFDEMCDACFAALAEQA